ncbi:MAG: 1-acyl-sn-glycerol-3-phosphate acyltransferase [Elusimicrobia bacterium CG08_land_8_20_14_0_20_51_18]|nr:MAG: 1-acyl-sn-glycerol-3-phosphate acyltransferase [Elusimicrobia bacterium CG08_land_8_20_14_0_20_51_18]
MRFFVFTAIKIWLKLLNSIEIRGLENVPEKGALIMAANHLSNADPPAIAAFASGVRPISIMAKKELFKYSAAAWLLRRFGAIPVDRHSEGGAVSALKRALEALKGGGCLLLFPEGTRARGRELEPKSGIAYLAHKTGAPVLPVRIFNSENFSKLGKIIIVFGKAVSFDPGLGKDGYRDFAAGVMEKIFSIEP